MKIGAPGSNQADNLGSENSNGLEALKPKATAPTAVDEPVKAEEEKQPRRRSLLALLDNEGQHLVSKRNEDATAV